MVLCTQQYKSAFMAFIQTSSFKLAANVSLSETKKKKKKACIHQNEQGSR